MHVSAISRYECMDEWMHAYLHVFICISKAFHANCDNIISMFSSIVRVVQCLV